MKTKRVIFFVLAIVLFLLLAFFPSVVDRESFTDVTAAFWVLFALFRGVYMLALSAVILFLPIAAFRLINHGEFEYNEVKLAEVGADALIVLSAATSAATSLLAGVSPKVIGFCTASLAVALAFRIFAAYCFKPEKVPFSETSFSVILPAIIVDLGISTVFSVIAPCVFDGNATEHLKDVVDLTVPAAVITALILLFPKRRSRAGRLIAGACTTVFIGILSVVIIKVRIGSVPDLLPGFPGAFFAAFLLPTAMISSALGYKKWSVIVGSGISLLSAAGIAIISGRAISGGAGAARVAEDIVFAVIVTHFLIIAVSLLIIVFGKKRKAIDEGNV